MIEEIKVSELPEASQINDDDLIMIVQSGTNKKITKENCQFASGDEVAVSTTEPSEDEKLWVDPTNAYVGIDEGNKDYYSTSEVKTNKVWVDGKPIYRKIIDVGYLPNNTTKVVDAGLTGVVIVQMYGIARNSSNATLTIPEANGGNSIRLVYNASNQVEIGTTYDRSSFYGYVILEYTK